MKKRVLSILLAVFIIAGGGILLRYKNPQILENNSELFKSKQLSSEETKKILKSVNLDIDFKKAEELYNDIDFPSDGYRYVTIESNKRITDDFIKMYDQGKKEKIENKIVRYKKIDRNEAIKLLKQHCSNKELLNLIKKNFYKKGSFYGVMEINNLGESSNIYDEIYIISCLDAKLYIFNHKI